MSIEVVDNAAASRFELFVDGAPAGFSEYHDRNGRRAFTHTEVDDAFEGQGLGSRLARFVLDDARAGKLPVLPFCPFIRAFIDSHREYVDLVPEAERERFGLTDR